MIIACKRSGLYSNNDKSHRSSGTDRGIATIGIDKPRGVLRTTTLAGSVPSIELGTRAGSNNSLAPVFEKYSDMGAVKDSIRKGSLVGETKRDQGQLEHSTVIGFNTRRRDRIEMDVN